MQQEFTDDVLKDLKLVSHKLPDAAFVGRVPQYGPRRPYYAVVRYLLDTHPEAAKILGKEAKDDSNADS